MPGPKMLITANLLIKIAGKAGELALIKAYREADSFI